MQEIKLRTRYRGGTVKKLKGTTRSNNSGKSKGKDTKARVFSYDPSKHVLIIGADGKRRWDHRE